MFDDAARLRQKEGIYFDHNATTPVYDGVLERLAGWAELWGNPSSIHTHGRGPKSLRREAGRQLAHMLGCNPMELIFTSGGSEANNSAIKGVYNRERIKNPLRSPCFVTSSVEHPSVLKTMMHLKELGCRVHVIPVDRNGTLDREAYEKALEDDVDLVSIMYANNETGVIFPIKELAQMAHERGALFHCDGVQALGKTDIDLQDWDVDMASFSGHKYYALKGCGLLYVKSGTSIENLIHGGSQERSRRAGTENTLAIASLGYMAQFKNEIASQAEKVRVLRDTLEEQIEKKITEVSFVARQSHRIPNTSSLIVEGVDESGLLISLDLKRYSLSAGTACSSGNLEPSPTLTAMGLTSDQVQSSLRISLGWANTREEVDRFVDDLVIIVQRLRDVKKRASTHAG